MEGCLRNQHSICLSTSGILNLGVLDKFQRVCQSPEIIALILGVCAASWQLVHCSPQILNKVHIQKWLKITILKFCLVLSQIPKELYMDDIRKPLLKIAFIQFCLGVLPPAYFEEYFKKESYLPFTLSFS